MSAPRDPRTLRLVSKDLRNEANVLREMSARVGGPGGIIAARANELRNWAVHYLYEAQRIEAKAKGRR